MIKEGNYIVIPAFARTTLDLKGNELLLYSLIYGFSQDEKSGFTGSIGYMCEWLGVSKNTVLKAIRNLIDKKLIDRQETEIGPVTIHRYRAIVPNFQNCTPGAEIEPPGAEIEPPGAEIEPNNIVYTSNNIVNNNKSVVDTKRKRFVPPTRQEVYDYVELRGNKIDPDRWYDYYEANGWMVGKNHMKDWKAAVRTWEKNGYSNSPPKQQSRAGATFRDFEQRSYDYDDLQKKLGVF